jgi:S1-C subfamily serine protease
MAAQTEAQANAGFGLVVPAEVVRRVTPALVQEGRFDWPWLGFEGINVNLPLMEANQLEVTESISQHQSGSPINQAELQARPNEDITDWSSRSQEM